MSLPKKADFICNKCNEPLLKWQGKCPSCNSWGSVEESKSFSLVESVGVASQLISLDDIVIEKTSTIASIKEFDRVCGGGLVPKSVILIGGEPGIGKSTLLLQICDAIQSDKPAIYISGEEAVEQIRLRADRLKVSLKKIACASVICVENIVSTLEQNDPSIVIIDSIQTLYSNSTDGTPGTVSQMRACSHILIQWAKRSNSILIIVGHVTKDGTIAGPKLIEHMVDTVLYFEGDRSGQIRFLRSIKNRFGSTDVLGIFEIKTEGLMPVQDAAKAFLQNRSPKTVGSSVLASVDGNRVIMITMQSLIATSYAQSPKRSVVGWDISRLHMIAAILEAKCKVQLSNKDLYLNVVGGIKVLEPASDLPAALAILSAYYKNPLPISLAAFGEISLSGELHFVSKTEHRVKESLKLGYDMIIMPKYSKMEFPQGKIIQFENLREIAKWVEAGVFE